MGDCVCMYMSTPRQCCVSDFRVSGEDPKAVFMELLFTELPRGVTQLPGPGKVIHSVWQAGAQTTDQAMSELRLNIIGSASFLGWRRQLGPEVSTRRRNRALPPDT